MSPLEVYWDGRKVEEWPNSSRLTVNKWAEILGLCPQAVRGAYARAGGKLILKPGKGEQPKRGFIGVRNFPLIIEGFQKTPLRPDERHFHPWTLGVDTSHGFVVRPPRFAGKKSLFFY